MARLLKRCERSIGKDSGVCKEHFQRRHSFQDSIQQEGEPSLGSNTFAFWEGLDEATVWGGHLAYLRKTNTTEKVAVVSRASRIFTVPNSRQVAPAGPPIFRKKISFDYKGLQHRNESTSFRNRGCRSWAVAEMHARCSYLLQQAVAVAEKGGTGGLRRVRPLTIGRHQEKTRHTAKEFLFSRQAWRVDI